MKTKAPSKTLTKQLAKEYPKGVSLQSMKTKPVKKPVKSK